MIHRLTIVVLALLLAALVAFTYAGVTDLGLVYDDHRLVEQNPGLDGTWGSLWTSDLSGPGQWRIYRPLVAASWNLERGNVPLHHTVNVIWHVVAVWGVFGLALVLGPGTRRARFAAAAAAALFALHPLATEPVCWVSRRADVMAGALTLWSILACAVAVRGTRWWAPLAVLLAIGAMLSKEIGVIAPVMWIVVALALRGSLVRWGTAATVMVAGFAALRFALFGSVSGQPVAFVQNWVFDAPGAHPVSTALNLVTLAGSLVAFPNRLSADYSWHSVDPATWSPFGAVFGALILLAMLALVVVRRKHPAVVIGLATALAAYLPVSNLIVPIGAAFAERFLYLPLAGLALAFSSLFTRARAFEIGIGSIELGNDEEGEASLWRAAADPAIRRDALAELFNFYRVRGDVEGLNRVRDMAMDRTP